MSVPNLLSEYNFSSSHELGRGAFGVVYRATNLETGQEVALKLINAHIVESIDEDGYIINTIETDFNPDDEIRLNKMFNSECHPGIVCYYNSGYYEYHGKYYFVIEMQYIKGKNLAESKLPLTEDDVLVIFKTLMTNLDWLHQKGIAHRDLKLENIIDSISGPVIVDLGLSCTTRAFATFGKCDGIAGSIHYMAPEVFNRQVKKYPKLWLDADMWSMGIILYVLLSGHFPWDFENQMDYGFTVSNIPPEKIQINNPILKTLLWSLLDPNPLSRPTSSDCVDYLNF